MTIKIIRGDALSGLASVADESVHCCVTSPPYFGLRSYLPEDHPDKGKEIGLEATPEEFIANLVAVFREVRRVLRNDGVLFVNLGDSYASQGGGKKPGLYEDKRADGATWQKHRRPVSGLKAKDLIGIPWMLAFALRADGWYLRGDYIWHKPSCMPESVTDRCTKSHEYVFHLTKSASYFWDQEAIREDFADDRRGNSGTKSLRYSESSGRNGDAGLGQPLDQSGRNKRSVWSINPRPFSESHFATMPPELAETCIKAGCPKGGTVLDPFSGAGTTALVADRLQRNAIGIELHPDYPDMAEKRISGDRGGLLDLMEAVE